MAVKEASQTTKELANRILAFLRQGPAHFEDVLLRFRQAPYREILQAWGRLRKDGSLGREVETGTYRARDSSETGREGGS